MTTQGQEPQKTRQSAEERLGLRARGWGVSEDVEFQRSQDGGRDSLEWGRPRQQRWQRRVWGPQTGMCVVPFGDRKGVTEPQQGEGGRVAAGNGIGKVASSLRFLHRPVST